MGSLVRKINRTKTKKRKDVRKMQVVEYIVVEHDSITGKNTPVFAGITNKKGIDDFIKWNNSNNAE